MLAQGAKYIEYGFNLRQESVVENISKYPTMQACSINRLFNIFLGISLSVLSSIDFSPFASFFPFGRLPNPAAAAAGSTKSTIAPSVSQSVRQPVCHSPQIAATRAPHLEKVMFGTK